MKSMKLATFHSIGNGMSASDDDSWPIKVIYRQRYSLALHFIHFFRSCAIALTSICLTRSRLIPSIAPISFNFSPFIRSEITKR
jgi:hypothetical protein